LRRGEFKIDQIKEEWPARRAALFYDKVHEKLHSRASLQAPPGDKTRKLPLDLWVSSIAQDIDRKVEKVIEMGVGGEHTEEELTTALDAIGEHRGSLIKATLDGSLNKHLTDPDGANGVSNAQVAAERCLWKAACDITNRLTHIGTSADRAHQIARQVYMDAAVPLRKEGRWDEVEKVYKTALAEDPDNSWARDTLSFIQVARNPDLSVGEELKSEVGRLKDSWPFVGYPITGKATYTRTLLFHAQSQAKVGQEGSTLQLKVCEHRFTKRFI
jgi:hypothetical protein